MNTRVIDREWIAGRIPHQGSMCLLDRVESWDEHSIVCFANSHTQTENPLRANDRLGIVNAIEYAAQAMAVHGALLMKADEAPKAGFLTSVRDVRWHRSHFDDLRDDLKICAHRFSGNATNVLYEFEIHSDSLLLISGRGSVILDAAEFKKD